MNEEVLIPLAMFVCAFGVLYVFFTTRNKERLALIEKGGDASMLKVPHSRYSTLKWGMFLTGIATGFLLGYCLNTRAGMKEEVAFFSMTFLCGGLSLIIYYFIERSLSKKDPN